MLNEASKVDLKQFIKLLIIHKYKIILFTFVIVISTNIYSLQFKDTVSLKKVIVVNKPLVNQLLSMSVFYKNMEAFKKKYEKVNGSILIKYFRLYDDYRMEFITKSTDEQKVYEYMKTFMSLFHNEVVFPLVKKANLALKEIEQVGYPLKKIQIGLKEKKEEIDNQLLKLLSNKSEDKKQIELLSNEKILIENLLAEFEKKNKHILNQYNRYNSYFSKGLKEDEIFQIEDSLFIYTHSKIKFFIFSLVFGLITAIVLIALFFNRRVI